MGVVWVPKGSIHWTSFNVTWEWTHWLEFRGDTTLDCRGPTHELTGVQSARAEEKPAGARGGPSPAGTARAGRVHECSVLDSITPSCEPIEHTSSRVRPNATMGCA